MLGVVPGAPSGDNGGRKGDVQPQTPPSSPTKSAGARDSQESSEAREREMGDGVEEPPPPRQQQQQTQTQTQSREQRGVKQARTEKSGGTVQDGERGRLVMSLAFDIPFRFSQLGVDVGSGSDDCVGSFLPFQVSNFYRDGRSKCRSFLCCPGLQAYTAAFFLSVIIATNVEVCAVGMRLEADVWDLFQTSV